MAERSGGGVRELPVAVVTGANRGIGHEVARQLARRGHRVVLGSRDLTNGQAAARIDPDGTQVVAVRLDVADDASVAAMADRVTGGTPAYGVSKAALNALTRLLAGELHHDRILVNSVCPGWTATDMGGGRPVPEGAAGVVWAATLPDDGPTGGFFRDGEAVAW
ncbi:MAG: SDR family NAD(P)-dependent oxidoreductase [Streptomyces sp.]|nr:SDR family NAD(P)-dependent oxidoreductase [Streptomyces sp.]